MKQHPLTALQGESLWRDLSLAAGVAVVAALLSAQVELHELVFAFTRRFVRPETAEPGLVSHMTRRSAKSAHEQQAHGDEQQSADADAGQHGWQRSALQEIEA